MLKNCSHIKRRIPIPCRKSKRSLKNDTWPCSDRNLNKAMSQGKQLASHMSIAQRIQCPINAVDALHLFMQTTEQCRIVHETKYHIHNTDTQTHIMNIYILYIHQRWYKSIMLSSQEHVFSARCDLMDPIVRRVDLVACVSSYIDCVGRFS